MSKTFEEFKALLKRHALGLPFTSFVSLVLSSALPFLRWPFHAAFLQTLKRAEKDGKPFPDIFFNNVFRHAWLYLLLIFAAFPFLYACVLLFAFFFLFGGILANSILIVFCSGLFVFAVFLLLHPLSFYLVYAWENGEKGFLDDLRKLKDYFLHWFASPGKHLWFSLKCFLVYFLCGLVFLAAAGFFFGVCFLLNMFLLHLVTVLLSFLAVLIFVVLLALSFLYLAPFVSYLTLKMYEPLAPKENGGGEYSDVEESGEPPYGEVDSEQLKHWKLTVAYDGTKFCGWQIQPGVRTVQGELQAGLKRLFREEVTVTACSRTDSGVHAQGQTVDFFTARDIPPEKLLRALNTYTPEDISVTKIEEVPPDFHSTFSARGKHYRYTVFTGEADDVMTRNFHLLLRRDLDIEAMRRAAACFVGEKEYKGLQVKSGKPEEATVRLVTAAEVRREGDLVIIDIWGKGFMYKQVRSMAGLLLAVGEGRVRAEETEDLMSGKAGARKTEVAPPQGLCLVKVYYDQEEFEKRL